MMLWLVGFETEEVRVKRLKMTRVVFGVVLLCGVGWSGRSPVFARSVVDVGALSLEEGALLCDRDVPPAASKKRVNRGAALRYTMIVYGIFAAVSAPVGFVGNVVVAGNPQFESATRIGWGVQGIVTGGLLLLPALVGLPLGISSLMKKGDFIGHALGAIVVILSAVALVAGGVIFALGVHNLLEGLGGTQSSSTPLVAGAPAPIGLQWRGRF